MDVCATVMGVKIFFIMEGKIIIFFSESLDFKGARLLGGGELALQIPNSSLAKTCLKLYNLSSRSQIKKHSNKSCAKLTFAYACLILIKT